MRAFHSNENGLFCTHPFSDAPIFWWKERFKQEALIWIKHLNRTLQYAFIWRTCRIFVSTFSLEAKDLHRSSTHPLKWTLLLCAGKRGAAFDGFCTKSIKSKAQMYGKRVCAWNHMVTMSLAKAFSPPLTIQFMQIIPFSRKKNRNKKGCNLQPQSVCLEFLLKHPYCLLSQPSWYYSSRSISFFVSASIMLKEWESRFHN